MILVCLSTLACSSPDSASEIVQEETRQLSSPVRSVELRYEGLQAFSRNDLEKAAVDELSDLEKYGFRRAEVDDAAFVMETYYQSHGYPFARVRYRYEVDHDKLLATFLIQEGPYTYVESIDFGGNKVFSTEEIHSFFLSGNTREPGEDAIYVESIVADADKGLLSAYQARGYLGAQISKPEVQFSDENQRVQIKFAISEGPQYRIHRIELVGNRNLQTKELEPFTQEFLQTPYFPRRSFELKSALQYTYANKGYPESQVTITEAENDPPQNVVLIARIEEGPEVTIQNIRVQNEGKTGESYIISRLEMKPGDRYQYDKERKSFANLFRTGLFRRVRFQLEGSGNDRTWVVQLEENPSKEISLMPGYGSYEQLRVEIGLKEKNFLGTGRGLRTELEASLKSESALIGFTDPWFFGTDFTLDLPIYTRRREEPSFTRRESGLGLLLKRQWSKPFSTTFGYNLSRSEVSEVTALTGARIPVQDVRLANVFVEPRHDTRNDLFNPNAGHLFSIRMEYGDRFLASQLGFWRSQLALSQYFSLDEDLSLALSFRTGFILPVGDTKQIPIQERFFNGGENTVRSFEESRLGPTSRNGRPVGGETRNIINVELRQRLAGSLFGAVFLDYGNVGFEFEDYFDDFRAGVGAGLRYLLPVGAVRLDGGYNPARRQDESSFEIHLSVGMAF